MVRYVRYIPSHHLPILRPRTRPISNSSMKRHPPDKNHHITHHTLYAQLLRCFYVEMSIVSLKNPDWIHFSSGKRCKTYPSHPFLINQTQQQQLQQERSSHRRIFPLIPFFSFVQKAVRDYGKTGMRTSAAVCQRTGIWDVIEEGGMITTPAVVVMF